MPTIDKVKAAQALIDAAVLGDTQAAKKHNVSTRTIERWRHRMDNDPQLAGFVEEMREKQNQIWAAEIPVTLTACIEYVKQASQIASKTDPEAIAAIVSAIETLSDVSLTWKMIDERAKAARREAEAT